MNKCLTFGANSPEPWANRTSFVSFAVSFEPPTPVLLSGAHMNTQAIHASSRGVSYEAVWLENVPKDTLLHLGLEFSAPQGVLGKAKPSVLPTKNGTHRSVVSLMSIWDYISECTRPKHCIYYQQTTHYLRKALAQPDRACLLSDQLQSRLWSQ